MLCLVCVLSDTDVNFLVTDFLFVGILSGTGLEAHIFDKMPNRDKNLLDHPDYQILLMSVARDDHFYDHGQLLNLKESVILFVCLMMFNATSNNSSAIS